MIEFLTNSIGLWHLFLNEYDRSCNDLNDDDDKPLVFTCSRPQHQQKQLQSLL